MINRNARLRARCSRTLFLDECRGVLTEAHLAREKHTRNDPCVERVSGWVQMRARKRKPSTEFHGSSSSAQYFVASPKKTFESLSKKLSVIAMGTHIVLNVTPPSPSTSVSRLSVDVKPYVFLCLERIFDSSGASPERSGRRTAGTFVRHSTRTLDLRKTCSCRVLKTIN